MSYNLLNDDKDRVNKRNLYRSRVFNKEKKKKE